MGYRSDVVIATNLENKDLVALLQDADPDEMTSEHGKIWVTFEQVKWYESYSDVSKIMTALTQCEPIMVESKFGSYETDSYAFMRIGEDYDDIETHGDCYEFGINLSRNIEVDYDAGNNN